MSLAQTGPATLNGSATRSIRQTTGALAPSHMHCTRLQTKPRLPMQGDILWLDPTHLHRSATPSRCIGLVGGQVTQIQRHTNLKAQATDGDGHAAAQAMTYTANSDVTT